MSQPRRPANYAYGELSRKRWRRTSGGRAFWPSVVRPVETKRMGPPPRASAHCVEASTGLPASFAHLKAGRARDAQNSIDAHLVNQPDWFRSTATGHTGLRQLACKSTERNYPQLGNVPHQRSSAPVPPATRALRIEWASVGTVPAMTIPMSSSGMEPGVHPIQVPPGRLICREGAMIDVHCC